MKNIKRLFASGIAAMMLMGTIFPCGNEKMLSPFTGNAFVVEAQEANSSMMQGVYNAFLSEGSDYDDLKKSDPYTSLSGDKITVTATGEYINGTWQFSRQGDYIVATITDDDFYGAMMFQYVCTAVGQYLGMDKHLMFGYIAAVGIKKLSKEYITITDNAANGTTEYKVYAGGKYDFSDLNKIYLDKDALSDVHPLKKNDINNIVNIGKISMYSFGNRNSVDIVIAEYGKQTSLSKKSLISAVKKLKPAGYKTFLKNFKKLSRQKTDEYTVSLPTAKKNLPEVFRNESGSKYKYVKVHFGKK